MVDGGGLENHWTGNGTGHRERYRLIAPLSLEEVRGLAQTTANISQSLSTLTSEGDATVDGTMTPEAGNWRPRSIDVTSPSSRPADWHFCGSTVVTE